MRRIEAVTGPEATRLFEDRTALLRDLSSTLKVSEGELARAVERLGERVKELQKQPAGQDGAAATDELVGAAADVAGVPVITARSDVGDAKELLALSDRVRQKLGDAVVVLGTAGDGRVHLVAQVAPGADRARPQGRPDHQGRRPGGRWRRGRARHHGTGRRPRSREARRRSGGRPRSDRDRAFIGSVRVLALDHGEARCGCAVSDPSGTLATPLQVVDRPDTRKGLARLGALAADLEAELVLVGSAADAGGRARAPGAGSRAFRRPARPGGYGCPSRCTTSA